MTLHSKTVKGITNLFIIQLEIAMVLNQQCFEEIQSWGFEGFLPVSTLKTTLELTNHLDTVPHQSGVYLVLNPTLEKPNWLRKSVGGHFKGEDPTVASIFLEKNWVNGAKILYVGETQRTLEKRVSELIQWELYRIVTNSSWFLSATT